MPRMERSSSPLRTRSAAECHDAAPLLRGVLAMKPVSLALSHARETTLSRLVRDGFVRVMTARQSEKLDAYFEELSRNAPGLAAVAVYHANGRLRWGSRPTGLPPDALLRALRPGASSELLPSGGTVFSLVPLPMEERCEQCHKADVPVRGALVLAFRPAPGGNPAAELEAVVDTSLRTIMLSNLGRMITGFLRTVAETGAVESVALYDDAGRTYFTSTPGVPDALVSRTLATVQPAVAFVGQGRLERVLVAQPLPNEHACVRCHGTGSVRGVVTVSLSAGVAAEAQDAALRRTAIGTALTLAALLAVLYFLLQKLVIEPVQEIGAAADAVGDGNLDVIVRSARADGDEMKRLGSRVNQMVQGLRAKTVLERFVSRGTAAAAQGAASHATSGTHLSKSSTRLPMTVLFSDIRGFTGYAEGVTAEQVVELLNRFLQAQADAVERHGGDVDKFAGDELMAVFSGGEAPARAVMCAVEMLDAVARAEAGRDAGRRHRNRDRRGGLRRRRFEEPDGLHGHRRCREHGLAAVRSGAGGGDPRGRGDAAALRRASRRPLQHTASARGPGKARTAHRVRGGEERLRPRAVLVDCDPALFTIGLDVDDGLALLFLLGSPEVDLLGVTTTAGNTLGSLAFRDAKKLLALAGRPEIPVAKGAGYPLRARPTAASRLLVEAVRQLPGEITLLALGPLTNLAAAAEEDLFFERNIGRLVIMGGRSVSGKSDFNFRSDPRAAARVLKLATPKTLISFDLGLGVAITREDVRALLPSKNGLSSILCRRLSRFARFQDRFRALLGRAPGEARGGFHPWDVIAAAWLVAPGLFGDIRPVCVSVDSKGQTRFDAPKRANGAGEVLMPGTLDAGGFRDLFFERLGRACS